MQSWKSRYSYDRQHVLGSGSQGTVFLGFDNETNTQVVVKKVRLLSEKVIIQCEREKENLEKIDSQFVVKCLVVDIRAQKRFAYFVMEYIPGGTLKKFIRTHSRVSESTAKRWMQQLVSAMEVVWRMDIIHRDIKPDNILLTTSDENADIRLCDFGISKSIRSGLANSETGTMKYMAPWMREIGVSYGADVDMWALGIVYFEMLFGKIKDLLPKASMICAILDESDIKASTKRIIKEIVTEGASKQMHLQQLVKKFQYHKNTKLRKHWICKVYQMTNYVGNCPVIVKKFRQEYENFFNTEIRAVNGLAQEGLPSYVDSYQSDGRLYLVLEDFQVMNLEDFVKDNGPISEFSAKNWMLSLLKILQKLHSDRIIHTNISPRSIILNKNSVDAQIKLCELETAINDGDVPNFAYYIWSDMLVYWAPEKVLNLRYWPGIDVWALGCVFYYMLQGKPPVQARSNNPEEIWYKIPDAQKQIPPLKYCSEDCKRLILGMMEIDDSLRFSVAKCINDPFFKSMDEEEIILPICFRNYLDLQKVLSANLLSMNRYLKNNLVGLAYLLSRAVFELSYKAWRYLKLKKDIREKEAEEFVMKQKEFVSLLKPLAEFKLALEHATSNDQIDIAVTLLESIPTDDVLRSDIISTLENIQTARTLGVKIDCWRFELLRIPLKVDN